MSRDGTYRPRNYRKQMENDGRDLWQIDGQMDIGEAGVLSFYDEEYTGDQLRGIGRSAGGALTITNLSTGSTVLSDYGGSSPPVLPSTYGCIYFSCSSTMTNGSARLFSGKAGQILHIRFQTLGEGSTCSVIIGASGTNGMAGVRILGSTGSDCSSLTLNTSAASWGWVTLKCVEDGVWSIMSDGNQMAERMS